MHPDTLPTTQVLSSHLQDEIEKINYAVFCNPSALNYDFYYKIRRYNCIYSGYDVMHLIDDDIISQVDILFFHLNEWKNSYLPIMKLIQVANKNIKTVLIFDEIDAQILSSNIDQNVYGFTTTKTLPIFADIIVNSLQNGNYFIDPSFSNFILELLRPKKSANIKSSLQLVSFHLKEKELFVLRNLAEGKSYEDIAVGLLQSIDSVRYYVKSTYKKLNVNRKGEAIRLYYENFV